MKKNVKIRLSTITIFFIIIIFIESIMSYYNSEWALTIYNRYAKSMARTNFTIILFILGYGGIFVTTIYYAIQEKINKGFLSELIICFILGVISAFWTYVCLSEFTIANIIVGREPASMFFLLFCFVLGSKDDFFIEFKKFILFACLIYAILAIIDVLLFLNIYGMKFKITSSPSLTFLQYSLFLLHVYIATSGKLLTFEKSVILICLLLLFGVAIVVLSRSWIIQLVILMICMYIYDSNYKKKKLKKTVINIALLFVSLFIFWQLANIYFYDAIELLKQRGLNDTRTNQYITFFDQVSFRELFWGQGMGATYDYGTKKNYAFLDNQFLMLMFRYGISSMILYGGFIFIPIIKTIKRIKNPLKYSMPLIAWSLAMMGLSTYFSVDNTIMHLSIIIYVGQLLKLSFKKGNRRNYKLYSR